MKKIALILLIFFWANPSGFAQLKTYSFEQIDSLQTLQKRITIVFIHTDWCKYCQAMKNSTFKNEQVIKELNDNFYFVDFNAEEKRTIVFNKQNFLFKPTGINGGINELAIALGTVDNKIRYPVLCVLNQKNEIIFQHNSYLNVKEFLSVLESIKKQKI